MNAQIRNHGDAKPYPEYKMSIFIHFENFWKIDTPLYYLKVTLFGPKTKILNPCIIKPQTWKSVKGVCRVSRPITLKSEKIYDNN